MQRPLATVVIGGILSSTFLTLFLLPMLYRWKSEVMDSAGQRNPKLGAAALAVGAAGGATVGVGDGADEAQA